MEHFAVIVIEWVGRVIAQKLAGSALQAVWVRFSPLLQNLLKSAAFWRQKAEENAQAVDRVEHEVVEVLALLNTAHAQLAHLLARNEQLQAENRDLRARLAQVEPT